MKIAVITAFPSSKVKRIWLHLVKNFAKKK
jgi:hypothetical protein